MSEVKNRRDHHTPTGREQLYDLVAWVNSDFEDVAVQREVEGLVAAIFAEVFTREDVEALRAASSYAERDWGDTPFSGLGDLADRIEARLPPEGT